MKDRVFLIRITAIFLLILATIVIKSYVSFGVGKYGDRGAFHVGVGTPYYGYPGWYGHHRAYHCPYHRIYHRGHICPRFNQYYRPWERRWKQIDYESYRQTDEKGKTYWKMFNATPYRAVVYPKGSESVQLEPWDKRRVYRRGSFTFRIGNKTFVAKKHYIKINMAPATKQIYIETTNEKSVWKDWGKVYSE